MHTEFFGLRDQPFRLTPDSRYLYLGRGHARAKAYMEYCVMNRDSFVVITGEIGSGKTTLIKTLLAELDESVVVAKVYQTQLNETGFLQALLAEFGIDQFPENKVALLNALNMFLIDQYQQGHRVVLIIDEAQNLSKRVLEEVRLLSGMETEQEKLLNVVLAGQPELNEVLDGPDMEQLRQRVRLRFHLNALTEEETEEYIRHRLRVAADGDDGLFTADAFPLIYRYTGGVPRLINTLCDTALLCAYVDGVNPVNGKAIAAAVDELQWKPHHQRRNGHARYNGHDGHDGHDGVNGHDGHGREEKHSAGASWREAGGGGGVGAARGGVRDPGRPGRRGVGGADPRGGGGDPRHGGAAAGHRRGAGAGQVNGATEGMTVNALSFDVEDYYQVSGFSDVVSRAEWERFPSRVEGNTRRLLDLLEENDVRATFFVLGWVARRNRTLVETIAERGHEVACHGYSHELIYRQKPELFRLETRYAKALLEDIVQRPVEGYRAASYSITRESLWALDILAEEGFVYDSSIYPIRHDRYGIPGAVDRPHRLATPAGAPLVEFPPATVNLGRWRLPVGGGGWFRLYPWWLTALGLAAVNARAGNPFMVYLHPWEIDPSQPRIRGRRSARFRHYVNIGRCEGRLRRLLRRFRFDTVAGVLCNQGLLGHRRTPQPAAARIGQLSGGGAFG